VTTKELIRAEIDRVNEEHLEDLYELVREFARARTPTGKSSLMAKLQSIQIDAPEDFAANLDLYTSGQKSVQPHIR
jgi:hypothetical protein